MSSGVEIEATDVIKIILQFCQENGLTQSYEAIQNECQIALNSVDNLEQFVLDIQKGKWDIVLPKVSYLQLPQNILEDLYEQVLLELLEMGEMDTARALLSQLSTFITMYKSNTQRYNNLKQLTQQTYFNSKEIWGGGRGSKDNRRQQLGYVIGQHVVTAPPSRLMTLMEDALKWQQHQGVLPTGKPNVFLNTVYKQGEGTGDMGGEAGGGIETHVRHLYKQIDMGKGTYVECGQFSPDGTYFVTGSVDGFIEVWDPSKCKLFKQLQYQSNNQFMMHNSAVLCLTFNKGTSLDKLMLATGSQDGNIKVWLVRTGQCLRNITHAHTQGVTSVMFNNDGTQVLSSSFDASIRVHGLRSGSKIKEFLGHTSYVNSVTYTTDYNLIMSGSSDCTVRIWEVKTCMCMSVITPPGGGAGGVGGSVHTLIMQPPGAVGPGGSVFVGNQSGYVSVLGSRGEVLRSFQSGKREGGEFLSIGVSKGGAGGYLYGLGVDGNLYCFGVAGGVLEHMFNVHGSGDGVVVGGESKPVGVCVHPQDNMVVTWAEDGTVKFWKP